MPRNPRAGSETSPDRFLLRFLACWPNDPDHFQHLCHQVTDWSGLLDCAERHAVLGVFHQPLLQLADTLDPPIRKQLQQRRVYERLWGANLEQNLCQALQTLQAAGVRTVVLKGPVLAERLYFDSSLRFSNDLDFLIAPQDLDRATSALASLGYQPEPESSAWYFRQHHHHLCLDAPHRPTVELHFRAFSGFGVRIEARELLRQARAYRTQLGMACEVLSTEDELLFLALHAAGHAFERLSWLFDLKTLLRRHADLDWARLYRHAHSLGVARALAFSLHLLTSELKVELPIPLHLSQSDGNRWTAATFLLSALRRTRPASPFFTFGKVLFQTLLCDRAGVAVRHLQHHSCRIFRRRLQGWLPRLLPVEWAA